MAKNEKQYYEVIKSKIEDMLKTKFNNFHLEVSADKEFSNKLKSKIDRNREMIFRFLKDIRPDITGFVEKNSFSYFIIIEIKDEPIKLDYIYQTRKYAELFAAKYVLLISTYEIPEEIKRLDKIIYPRLLNGGYGYERVILVHFDTKNQKFSEWYERNPFETK